MNIREERENLEEKILSEFAVKSKNSKGRKVKENLCEIRTVFHQDKDRIIHSKSFRRLKHKTQVFISYQPGDHYRTRLTHTLEVSQISRTIARALNLNEDLTEAIALGHDLGHTPFGHSGENVLNKISFLGFKHNKQSLRVVENLEKKGKGLNLSEEVLDGILNHTGQNMPYTLEGQIVKISDRIAYINHDIEDGISVNLLKNSDLPKDFIEILGKTTSERIDKMVIDMIKYSRNQNKIKMSKEVEEAILGLRKFLFENLYFKGEVVEKLKKAEKIIEALYFYYQENYDKVYFNYSEKKERNILDYISGMTDSYALEKFKNIYIP